MANTAGGQVFIGVDDKNTVSGCKLTNEMKSRVQDIANNCDPRVLIKIKSIKYKDKEVVLIMVPESDDKPVQCSDGFFIREGANSQKMTRNEIFYWAQKTRKIRYESQLREDFQYPGDFNEERFVEFMKKMNVTITGQPEDMLANLGLGENKKGFIINNAGIMLFGHKRRDLYIRQVYVTCVLYKGTNKVKIIDRKDFRDDLVQDYENAFKFLQQHLRLEYVIEGGRPREEIPEIPYDALKEALLNSIIHRDYFEIGARVMVEIFDDRVEISNPGELLVDEKEFGKKAISVARNPVLFDIFHRLQLIEKVGTGVQRIIKAIQARKLSIEFYFGRFFSVTFFRLVLPGYPKDIPGLVPDKIAKIPLEKVEEDIAETGQVPDKYRTSPGKKPDKIVKSPLEKSEEDITGEAPCKYPASIQQALNKFGWTWDKFNGFVPCLSQVCPKSVPCEIAAVILISAQKEINIMDLMKILNKTNRTRFRKFFLDPLIEAGLIVFAIPGKPRSSKQKYIISEKGENLLKKFTDIFKQSSLDKELPKEYEVEQLEIELIEAPRKYPASIQHALNKFGWTWDKFSGFVLSLSQVCPKSVPCEIVAIILISAQEEINIMDLMKISNKTNRTRFKKYCLNPLIEVGFIEFTIPGKPKSSQQKYIITEKGKKLLKKYQD